MVDFIDLANGQRFLLSRILGDEDDDFVKMENVHSSSTLDGSVLSQPQQAQLGGASSMGETPFLSKSAEAELYLLLISIFSLGENE